MDELEKADQTYIMLNEKIREANRTLKDLKRERRELEEAFRDRKLELDTALRDALKESLPEVGEAIDKLIKVVEERVFKRFDDLTAILLGEDLRGKPKLVDLAREAKARGSI